jgi:leucyl aminopeptidase
VTTISLTSAAPATAKTDAVVVGVARQPADKAAHGTKRKKSATSEPALALPASSAAVDAALGGSLLSTLNALGAKGGAEEVTKIASNGALGAPLLVVVGLGDVPADGAGYDAELLRRAAGAVARALTGTSVSKALFALPADDAERIGAVAEGALYGAYQFDTFKGESRTPIAEAQVATTAALARKADVKSAVASASALGEYVGLTRDLVNTPPGHLPPAEFADRVVKAVAELPAGAGKVTAEVLDEKALRKGGYGGILGVGQGSARPPRLVRVGYTHPKAKHRLAFVGKGITFDSGGLSLKPPASMTTMKCDMAGAAAVVGAVLAIAAVGLPVNVTGWAPLAENMPGGGAIRPSDVLSMYGGKTVEVLNTDAEGRLVLADALVRSGEEKPDVVVDMATLTGAAVLALGERTAAIMSDDDTFRTQVYEASRRAGEAMWPVVMPAELRKSLDSEVADLQNVGQRMGGMQVAGLFLKEFVPDGVKWAHIDIAGPAFNEGAAYGYTPKGATGSGLRTLVRLAADVADGTIKLG